MSDNTKYDDEKVLSLRELLEQDDPGAITKSNLSYCLDIITELKDENESLWFMLEEQKNSKWTSEHSVELEKAIQEQLAMLKLMNMNKGEA